MMARRLETCFIPLVALLLAVMAGVMIFSIFQETPTWDEAFDLAAGYSYWKTGDFRINREHPPLGKYINALPLLFLNPSLPLDHASWKESNHPVFGGQFLFHNRVPADTLMLAGRSMTILLTLCLGLALALWTRWRFGAPAALAALLFLVFDPNLIAHGRYVTSDLIVTLSIFLAVAAWWAWLDSGRTRDLILAGLTLGLAVMSKFSALALLPIYLFLYLVRRRRTGGAHSVFHLARPFLMAGFVAFLVMVVVYAPEAYKLIPVTHSARLAQPGTVMLRDAIDTRSAYGKTMAWAGRKLGLRDHSFLVALGYVAAHNTVGHQAYLLGMHSEQGWWYYFPVVFAVKTPTATLLALLLAAALALRRFQRACEKIGDCPSASTQPTEFRRPVFGRLGLSPIISQFRREWLVLLIPAVTYFAISMTTGINIGVRHLLPVYPFLFAFIGAVLAGDPFRFRKPALAALAVLLAAESLAIYPHYLAFFNRPSGGPANGPRYLVDSNIDWGQDVKKLKAWLDARKVPEICACFFGSADLWYYGIPYRDLPQFGDDAGWEKLDCVAAVSVTPLYGVYVHPDQLAHLRSMQPIARIGYSIYVYDLRKGTPVPLVP